MANIFSNIKLLVKEKKQSRNKVKIKRLIEINMFNTFKMIMSHYSNHHFVNLKLPAALAIIWSKCSIISNPYLKEI